MTKKTHLSENIHIGDVVKLWRLDGKSLTESAVVEDTNDDDAFGGSLTIRPLNQFHEHDLKIRPKKVYRNKVRGGVIGSMLMRFSDLKFIR